MGQKIFDIIMAFIGIGFGIYETASSIGELKDIMEKENDDGSINVVVDDYSYDPETKTLTYKEQD